MAKKQLTDSQIKEIIFRLFSPSQTSVSDTSFCSLGERVFFESPLNSPANSSSQQRPYYVGQIINTDNMHKGIVTVKSLEECEFLPLGAKLIAFSEEAEKGIPDMVNLDKLNNATLLYNLKTRYNKTPKEIYTYVSPSLLVINPYKPVPHLMTQEIFDLCQSYIERQKDHPSNKTVPHTYSIAAKALRNLYTENERQAIVISGESGAGKTETAKIAMGFLANCSKKDQDNSSGTTIEKKIIACNPVLEAFGNANTPKNHNSSRFGKYVKILFDVQGKKILGAYAKPYLLEKSRVVKLTPLDRNYHIFYHLLKGASIELLKQLYLVDENGSRPSKEHFTYLRNGCENSLKKPIDDAGLFNLVVSMLSNELGFTPAEQFSVWRIVAAVLHIGNMTLDTTLYDDSKNAPCGIANKAALEKAATLLGCSPADLQREILYRGAVMDSSRVACKPVESSTQRDSLAKALYNSLFTWLVSKINETTLNPELKDSKNASIKTIGLLDIYGFECMQHNDYEQLLINYTNEKLQKLYLNAIFETEKVVFKEEGLGRLVTTMTYTDRTTPVIELLDNRARGKPQGLLNRVDDYRKNEDFVNLLGLMTKDFKDCPNYARHKERDKFIVKHTAKDVVYCVREFIEKNQDRINDDMKSFMLTCFDSSIAAIVKVFPFHYEKTIDGPGCHGKHYLEEILKSN